MNQSVREKSHELLPYVVAFRREAHMYPEASMHEVETTNRIAKALDELGISYRRLDPTGLVGEIKGGKPGKTVALRADIDALSIREMTDVPFKSVNDGYMHACGHDTHQASLLGAVRILNDMKEELSGNVRFIFQPAEETAQGAKLAVEQGVLDGVDAIYGQHIWGNQKAGALQFRSGAYFASCDSFKIRIIGKACHGSAPEDGVDATVCAAAVVMSLQTVVSREVGAMKPLVVTVGSLHSGTRFNIVSGEAVLEGTTRCFDVALHHRIPEMIERIVKATCEAYRCEYEFEFNMLTEPLVNDPELTEIAFEAARKVADSDDLVSEGAMIMGAEDFAEYTVHCPSVFGLVGGGGNFPQHSDYYYVDEASLEVSTAMYAQFAVDYLSR